MLGMLEWDGGWTGMQDAIPESWELRMWVSEVGTLQNVEAGYQMRVNGLVSHLLLWKKLNILEEEN